MDTTDELFDILMKGNRIESVTERVIDRQFKTLINYKLWPPDQFRVIIFL